MALSPNATTSSERLLNSLTIATDASIGVIAIRCPETEVFRVVDELYALAMSQKIVFRMHTTETGWCVYPSIDPEDERAEPFDPLNPSSADKGTAEIGNAFGKLFDTDTNESAAVSGDIPDEGVFVMLDTHYTFEEPKTQTRIRKQAQRSLNNGQRLFLIVPNSADIPDAISPLMHIIQFDYPEREELSATLDDIIDAIEEEERPEITDDDRDAILSNGQGMTTHAFETAVALSVTKYSAENDTLEGFAPVDIMDMIRDYKTQMLQKTNVLELQQPVPESEIGGLELFKEWMHERKATYTDHAIEAGVTPSRGALVIGPPGTGKSLVAKAAGSILNLPVIRFDVGRVFNQFIGQSEGAMRNVLTLIDAMSPCVLMLDEIDKGFSGMVGGANDSGTTQRVFGTFLTWMQERKQKERPVFLIMTANRIDNLPPELLRKGRIDETWSVNMPNNEEREAIINIHMEKRGQEFAKTGDAKAAVRITENLVGAEIEAIIEDALVLSLSSDEVGVTWELLEQAKAHVKSMHDTRRDELKAMADWATKNARPASKPMRSSGGSVKPRKAKGIKRGRVRTKVTRE